ncbi:hypothetical protein FOL47_000154 [Perkinsus chesapeaki]|uniref:Uncharacterized protein n=1 Tax=Perkinsus chesapeaki TaxID=330153 RepID=A0A7J6MND5_PERCH|nr:hypothetical protein FOL47_000154 [Perkinsus chesapeaki]
MIGHYTLFVIFQGFAMGLTDRGAVHPIGVYAGYGLTPNSALDVSASFAESITVVRELSYTFTRPRLHLVVGPFRYENIPYEMEGLTITFSSNSGMGAVFTYNKTADTITVAFPSTTLEFVLHKQRDE